MDLVSINAVSRFEFHQRAVNACTHIPLLHNLLKQLPVVPFSTLYEWSENQDFFSIEFTQQFGDHLLIGKAHHGLSCAQTERICSPCVRQAQEVMQFRDGPDC